MNRHLSDSPDKQSLNQRSSPTDQWRTRSVSPINNQLNQTADNNWRQFVSNPLPTFGPNFANQRFFTPRSSYFGSQNDNLVFTSSTTNMNPNYGNNYSNYECNQRPTLSQPSYVSLDTNRPVFSTNLSNISIDSINLDINELKMVLMNANQETSQPIVEKTNSPESTSCDSTANSMDVLISEMKKLSDKENQIKKTRRDVDRKITALDEELKEYEKKITFREHLKKIKVELERDEEELANKRRKVVSDMEKVNKFPNISSKDLNKISNESQVIDKSEKKEDNTSKRDDNQTVVNPVPKPALKRPNPSEAKLNPNKKVRINSLVSHSSGNTTKLNESSPFITPKVSTKPVKRTPIPSKLTLISNSTPEVDSPKISRICRQQTPNPTPSGVTSGVRTSRPQKMMSSRNKRIETTSQTSEQSTTSLAQKSTKCSEDSSDSSLKNSETNSTEPESDNEVFKELEKLSSKIDSNINQRTDVSERTPLPTVSKTVDKNEDKIEDQVIQTNNKSKDDNILTQKTTESSAKSDDNNVKNCENRIELVHIDSGDEEFIPQEEQPLAEIKSEKPDSDKHNSNKRVDTDIIDKTTETADNSLSEESQRALNLHPRTYSKSSESSETSEDQNSTKESPFKVPNDCTVGKKQYKFSGFDAIPYEPTVSYTISSFKAIAGPKSKSVASSVIFLKAFKDYLFASFMDQSVRRFHIEDKNNVLKYEGHQHLVLTLTIIECPKSADTFILYTGGKDKKLRAFNAITGQLLNTIELSDDITCIVYNWSHIFCALNDGNVCKVSPIHESNEQISDNSGKVQSFVVNAKKKIMAIVSVKAVDSTDNIEAIIALSSNKLRIVNTIDSISDEQRILVSFGVHFSAPVFMRTFRNILIIAFKCPPVKNEDKTKKEDKSRIFMYDLQKDWNAIKTIDVNGLITSMELSAQDLIVSCYSGRIQCIDCEKLELKWIAYSSRVTASVQIGDRLVLGTDQGLIDVIYLDQKFIDCETCGVTFARQIDFKKHIQFEHKTCDTSDEELTDK